MTPFAIEFLFHCNNAYPAPFERLHTLSGKSTLAVLLDQKLIEPMDEPDCYRTTLRGKAHVMQLCGLELPRVQFVLADGSVVDTEETGK